MIDDILEAILWIIAVVAIFLLSCWSGVFDFDAPLDPIPISSDEEWMLLVVLLLAAFCIAVAFIFHFKK